MDDFKQELMDLMSKHNTALELVYGDETIIVGSMMNILIAVKHPSGYTTEDDGNKYLKIEVAD